MPERTRPEQACAPGVGEEFRTLDRDELVVVASHHRGRHRQLQERHRCERVDDFYVVYIAGGYEEGALDMRGNIPLRNLFRKPKDRRRDPQAMRDDHRIAREAVDGLVERFDPFFFLRLVPAALFHADRIGQTLRPETLPVLGPGIVQTGYN